MNRTNTSSAHRKASRQQCAPPTGGRTGARPPHTQQQAAEQVRGRPMYTRAHRASERDRARSNKQTCSHTPPGKQYNIRDVKQYDIREVQPLSGDWKPYSTHSRGIQHQVQNCENLSQVLLPRRCSIVFLALPHHPFLNPKTQYAASSQGRGVFNQFSNNPPQVLLALALRLTDFSPTIISLIASPKNRTWHPPVTFIWDLVGPRTANE